MKSLHRLWHAFIAFAVVHVTQVCDAGTIHTSRAEYEVAVSRLSLVWSEDFESFAPGAAARPTLIGGGAAEIIHRGSAEIVPTVSIIGTPEADEDNNPLGTGNGWQDYAQALGETLRGRGNPSTNQVPETPNDSQLGVHAIGFDYFSGSPGVYNFIHGGGVDRVDMLTPFTASFIGWVGRPGEVLDRINYLPGGGGHTIDSIVAHVVPEPLGFTAVMTALLLLPAISERKRLTDVAH